MKKSDIIIAGGGAAGLMAALSAATYVPEGTKITVLEHKDSAGKKLLATGNGRCNFTNDVIDGMSYRGNDSSFAYKIIGQYNKEWLLQTMRDIGIVHTSVNGYYYPRSLQARTVTDCIISKLNIYGVDIICGANVSGVKKTKTGYRVLCDNDIYECTKLIMAMGGCTYSKLGSDGSGYAILKNLGHTVTALFPALTGLKARGLDFKHCHGVRAKGSLTVYADGDKIAWTDGEIQFTEYGISGIPVFQISRYASSAVIGKRKVTIAIDLVTEYTYNELVRILRDIADSNPYKTVIELLNGLIPQKLAGAILGTVKIRPDREAGSFSEKELYRIAEIVKNLTIDITGDCGFDKAQVTAGGIATGEVNADTMESKLCRGLYIAGELLDIDGSCGGYNLHFAFATGAAAGMNAALEVQKQC